MKFQTAFIIALACLLLRRETLAQKWPAQVVADAKKLEELRKSGDLSAMEAFIRANMPQWETLDARWYGLLMLRGVQLLGTGAFEDRSRSRELRRDLVRTALQKSGEITLEHQVGLTRRLYIDLMKPRAPDGWRHERRQDARLWLATWKRLHDEIDPDWVNEATYWNMAPPGMPSGTQPEEIEDPQMRAQFEADLAENERKAKRNAEQIRARRLAKTFFPRAKRYIADVYSRPPYAFEGLRELLLEYIAKEEARTEILSRVSAAMEGDK